jgi:soluble lytic murein transglycosylase
LMQLMPATARTVAKRLGDTSLSRNLYDVESNISLGSAYYRQLLDSYNGNRVLSLVAYNAGPARVRAWRSKAGEEIDVYQWIEAIPFTETRDYVQAVLSYNVVYQSLRQQTASLFNEAERNYRY